MFAYHVLKAQPFRKVCSEAAMWFPEWGKWLEDLEEKVMCKFPWRWGEGINKYHLREAKGQMTFYASVHKL